MAVDPIIGHPTDMRRGEDMVAHHRVVDIMRDPLVMGGGVDPGIGMNPGVIDMLQVDHQVEGEVMAAHHVMIIMVDHLHPGVPMKLRSIDHMGTVGHLPIIRPEDHQDMDPVHLHMSLDLVVEIHMGHPHLDAEHHHHHTTHPHHQVSPDIIIQVPHHMALHQNIVTDHDPHILQSADPTTERFR